MVKKKTNKKKNINKGGRSLANGVTKHVRNLGATARDIGATCAIISGAITAASPYIMGAAIAFSGH